MNLSNHVPILIIAIPLLAAFLVPLINRISKKATGILSALALSVSLILTIVLAVKILTVGPQVYIFGATSPSLALPSGLKFPIRIMFEVDAMGIFMGLITAVVSFLGAIYSLSFLKKYDGVDKYYYLLLLLTVSIFGMEFNGDIFKCFNFSVYNYYFCSFIYVYRSYYGYYSKRYKEAYGLSCYLTDRLYASGGRSRIGSFGKPGSIKGLWNYRYGRWNISYYESCYV